MHRLVAAAPLLLLLLPRTADAAVVLLSKRDASQIVSWDSQAPDMAALVHSTKCNDVDYNTAEGPELAWIVEHLDDDFGRFVVGSDVGLDAQFHLGDPGLTHYDYPKHVAAYNGEVVVMSRNDGTLWRYTPLGAQVGSVKTPANTGQGLATDGTDLFVSVWNGGASLFIRYDEGFTNLETFDNPTGMGPLNNIFDLVYDPATKHFFGLATTGEFGTPTESSTILEFSMGGEVHKTHTIPLKADGIGRFNDASCGDMVIDGEEQCDDGNNSDSDACTAACVMASCGDGFTWIDVEDCDDANDDETDACSTQCTVSFCGDGVVWAGVEACDDGDKTDENGCTNACTLPICGDGIVQAGEQCDDPNPLLCDDCTLVPIDLTTTSASSGDTTDTSDDTTGTSTTAVDATTDDPSTSGPAETTTTGDETTTTTTGADSVSGGFTGGGTGDVPTTDGVQTSTEAETTDTGTSSGSGTAGTASDDGCGCTTTPTSSLTPLLLLLAVPRRRRPRSPARRS